METLKIIVLVFAVAIASAVITGLAIVSYFNSIWSPQGSVAGYSAYQPGPYANNPPSTGNYSQYPAYPYPTYPNNPYPAQPNYPPPGYPPNYYPPSYGYPYGYPYGGYGEHGGWGIMG